MNTRHVLLNWPEKNEPTSFSDLVAPVIKALHFCYTFRRRNRTKDVPWTGLPLPENMKVTCLNYDETLSAEALAWSLKDQGRNALKTIIGIAVQLGIEQGRRVEIQRIARELKWFEIYTGSWNVEAQAQWQTLMTEIKEP